MRRIYLTLLTLLSISSFTFANKEVQIITPFRASSPEKIAAGELAGYLGKLYPDTTFTVADKATDKTGTAIRPGTPSSAPDLLKHISDRKLQGPESYVVTKATIDGRETGVILGADPAGVMFGVYGLLEKLGCGFFISFDTVPKPMNEEFGFDQWNLANRPLTPERIVFNWHNFISGCTTWDLKHWKEWIAQSQKSGFNTVMVHAYGNNPMFSFEFNSETKEVGYVATTRHGRDWGINHINDIRRGYGGFLFDDPVFGSEAAKVPHDQRVQAKQSMMRKAFEYAEERGVKINFALDVDTEGANPQGIITTLAEEGRFKISNMWVARPDTPSGYQYYKAQAKTLFDAYPQVTTLTLWRRKGAGFGSVWPLIKVSEMPESWQAEYNAHIAANPKAAKVHLSVFNFAIAKVFKAWRTSLDEMGKEEIPIATGSWRFEWLTGAVEFLPEDVKLLPLDYECMGAKGGKMNNQAYAEGLGKTIQSNRLVPIIWAHHDDGAYIGAPLDFLKNFNNKLETCGAGGFGIIHWMTHPFDSYFTSHIRQTWSNSQNESLKDTYTYLANRWFGPANENLMSGYLQKWITDMPSFGRETSNFFINRSMTRYGGLNKAVACCKERISILERADTVGMTDTQKKQLTFFKKYEQFVADFFRVQTDLDNAKTAFQEGNVDKARTLMSNCKPGEVISRYADVIRERGATRGEEGLVVTMNTRWIPHHVRFRQQIGIEPVRFNYAVTSHEELAQSRGTFTFHVTPDKASWQTFGKKETDASVFTIPAETEIAGIAEKTSGYDEICRSGIESGKPITIQFAPILRGKKLPRLPLPAGKYKLTLLMIEPTATKARERVMEVNISTNPAEKSKIDIYEQAGGKNRILAIEYPVTLTKPGNPEVTLTPVKGKALVCGALLTPHCCCAERTK